VNRIADKKARYPLLLVMAVGLVIVLAGWPARRRQRSVTVRYIPFRDGSHGSNRRNTVLGGTKDCRPRDSWPVIHETAPAICDAVNRNGY